MGVASSVAVAQSSPKQAGWEDLRVVTSGKCSGQRRRRCLGAAEAVAGCHSDTAGDL